VRAFDAKKSFRLAHYFDLIAGTSTGAIIAAALDKGLSIAEIAEHYLQMGKQVFGGKNWFSTIVRDKYKGAASHRSDLASRVTFSRGFQRWIASRISRCYSKSGRWQRRTRSIPATFPRRST